MRAKCIAIVLSAGSGKRMNSDTKKQYLLIKDKPVVYYSLKAFQDSSIIDEIVLVTSAEDIDYVKEEIVDTYGFTKVTTVTAGGRERYNSVYNGIKACSECDFIYIHDGARPFVTEEIIRRAYDTLTECGTAVVGMPVKDTIKIVDSGNNVSSTPDRNSVWLVQTPQCFSYEIALKAYENLIAAENDGSLLKSGINVTDDAMVVETFFNMEDEDEEDAIDSIDSGVKVRLVKGSYENIKITTPEDLTIAESFLNAIL